MKFKINNRQTLSLAAIILYLIPFLFFAFYNIDLMSKNKSWSILSLGLLMIAACSLILILFIYYWEQAFRSHIQNNTSQELHYAEKANKVTSIDSSLETEMEVDHPVHFNLLPSKSKEQESLLIEDLLNHKQEISNLQEENKNLQFQFDETIKDFSDYKLFSEEQLKQKNIHISDIQQVTDELQIGLDKKHLHNQQLEIKIRDLSYEIKTLLYLHDSEATTLKRGSKERTHLNTNFSQNSSQDPIIQKEKHAPTPLFPEEKKINPALENSIKTASEASELLKRCLALAQKLSGNHYYGNESSRYWEIPTPHYTIDQRRLFDSLRNENGAIILVYSPRDNRVLFVNNQCKEFLGWSPEKFIQGFGSIIQDGLPEWKKALSLLNSPISESQARLLIKSKHGEEIVMHCHLGNIASGVFKNYIIGVLYRP